MEGGESAHRRIACALLLTKRSGGHSLRARCRSGRQVPPGAVCVRAPRTRLDGVPGFGKLLGEVARGGVSVVLGPRGHDDGAAREHRHNGGVKRRDPARRGVRGGSARSSWACWGPAQRETQRVGMFCTVCLPWPRTCRGPSSPPKNLQRNRQRSPSGRCPGTLPTRTSGPGIALRRGTGIGAAQTQIGKRAR